MPQNLALAGRRAGGEMWDTPLSFWQLETFLNKQHLRKRMKGQTSREGNQWVQLASSLLLSTANFSFVRLVQKVFLWYLRTRALAILAGAQMFGTSLNLFYTSPESPKFSQPDGARFLLNSTSHPDVGLEGTTHWTTCLTLENGSCTHVAFRLQKTVTLWLLTPRADPFIKALTTPQWCVRWNFCTQVATS